MASGRLLLRIRDSLGQIWSSLGQGWDPFWNICGSSLLMWWEVLKPLGDCGRRGVGGIVFHKNRMFWAHQETT